LHLALVKPVLLANTNSISFPCAASLSFRQIMCESNPLKSLNQVKSIYLI
jgi:hypothetical protein